MQFVMSIIGPCAANIEQRVADDATVASALSLQQPEGWPVGCLAMCSKTQHVRASQVHGHRGLVGQAGLHVRVKLGEGL